MADFKPTPAQGTPNPANAFRPGRAIIDANRTGTEALEAGNNNLIRGIATYEARSKASRAQMAQKAARAAARELELDSLRLALRAEAEGSADGSGIINSFDDGFIAGDGSEVVGFRGLVDQYSKGMTPEERDQFIEMSSQINAQSRRRLTGVEVQRNYDYAAQQSARRLDRYVNAVSEMPDEYDNLDKWVAEEVDVTIPADSALGMETTKNARAELASVYIATRIAQDSLRPDGRTGAEQVLSELETGKFNEVLEPKQIQELKSRAQGAVDAYHRREQASLRTEITSAIDARMETGQPFEMVPPDIIRSTIQDPAEANLLIAKQEASEFTRVVRRDYDRAPLWAMADIDNKINREIAQAAASNNPEMALVAEQKRRQLAGYAEQVERRRMEDFAGEMTRVDPVLAEQEQAFIDGVSRLSQGDESVLDEMDGIMEQRAQNLRDYAEMGYVRDGRADEIPLLSESTAQALSSSLDAAVDPDSKLLLMDSIRRASGGAYGAVKRDLFGNNPDQPALAVAMDMPPGSPAARKLLIADTQYDNNFQKVKDLKLASTLDEGIRDSLSTYAQAANIQEQSHMAEAVKRLAVADIAQNGTDPDVAIENATSLLTDRFVVGAGTLLVDSAQVEDPASAVYYAEVFTADMDMRRAIAKVNYPGELQSNPSLVLDQPFSPRKDPLGRGVLITDADGTIMATKSGKDLVIPWDAWQSPSQAMGQPSEVLASARSKVQQFKLTGRMPTMTEEETLALSEADSSPAQAWIKFLNDGVDE